MNEYATKRRMLAAVLKPDFNWRDFIIGAVIVAQVFILASLFGLYKQINAVENEQMRRSQAIEIIYSNTDKLPPPEK